MGFRHSPVDPLDQTILPFEVGTCFRTVVNTFWSDPLFMFRRAPWNSSPFAMKMYFRPHTGIHKGSSWRLTCSELAIIETVFVKELFCTLSQSFGSHEMSDVVTGRYYHTHKTLLL